MKPLIFVLASKNKKKLAEMQTILGEQGIQVLSQAQAGVDLDPEETGLTFEENAIIKARAVSEASGLPAIADDSGLMVDALDGAPGVFSARYGGSHELSDEYRWKLLLKNMEGMEQRTAKYVSVIAAVFPDGRILTARGECHGEIAESPRGVLGEQRTKTLRGAKMEDVIFGGTAQRGPAGFAQVSLILGNEDRSLPWDADEVMITRRYYRSGDSEYYINRKLVRLKDVNALLMDTGLGRDGYSLVGQGRVDEVLAAKSTDRREIFEEAAGISKYRYQREETLRKLERTEQDMLRLGDKLGELNLQLEPLRKQAETAKKYLILRDELRGLEISLWMDALDRLADQTRILTQEYETAEARLRTQKEDLEKLYRTSEDCSEGIRAADEKAEQLRMEIGQLENQASELSHEADLLDAEERSNQAAIRRLDEENARQRERITDLTARLAERQERLNALAAEREALEQEKQRLFRSSSETSLEAERSEKDLEALTAKAAEEENAAAAEAARLETIESSAAAQTESLRETQEERDRLRLRLEEESTALKRTEEQLQKKREAAVEAENQCKGHRMLADTRRERLRTQEERLRKLRMDEESIRSRVSLLTDMEKEYEGFSRAVRVVMREKGRGTLRGIHSTVAGLIHTEDGYSP